MPSAIATSPRPVRSRLAVHVLQLLMLLALLGICAAPRAAPNPTASVDRSVVALGDSLTLTIHVDDTGVTAPDLTLLQRDFELYGTSQSTQRSLVNGRLQSSMEWQVTLMPKRSGDLVIPALQVGDGATQPLTVRVGPASGATAAGSADEPVFLEAQLDRTSVYVQQQAVLTVRVFHAIQLDDMQLSEPSFDNASVRKIAETSFRREIRGVTYLVHERSYAIFPQQPGELTIPELVFNALQPTSHRSMFGFPGQGRPQRKMTQQLQLTVKPIPKSFTGPVWLPATRLALDEHWSNPTRKVQVGDSITRRITVQADGLLAAQLPALEPPQLDNAKVYNDQPTLDDQQDARGVQGKRTENMALIPSRPGRLALPEVRVVWWDVNSDTERVATLAPSTLQIEGGAASAPVSAPPAAAPDTPTTAPAPAMSSPLAAAASAPASTSLPWQIATSLFALAWLVTLYLYWRLRRGGTTPRSRGTEPASTTAMEAAAFRRLQEACRAGDTGAARTALIAWARAFYRAPDIRTVEDVLQRADDPLLLRELQQLDNQLFGRHVDSTAWNGENLLSVVRGLRGAKTTTAKSDELLALYPT